MVKKKKEPSGSVRIYPALHTEILEFLDTLPVDEFGRKPKIGDWISLAAKEKMERQKEARKELV
jgi:hypothetical protein